MKLFNKYVTCIILGHMSTGTFLYRMCDRCHGYFEPKHITYTADGKLSTSR
jgi:hypothetical protein